MRVLLLLLIAIIIVGCMSGPGRRGRVASWYSPVSVMSPLSPLASPLYIPMAMHYSPVSPLPGRQVLRAVRRYQHTVYLPVLLNTPPISGQHHVFMPMTLQGYTARPQRIFIPAVMNQEETIHAASDNRDNSRLD